ncbi:unnamed protein product [Caenorhabditis brenneri]
MRNETPAATYECFGCLNSTQDTGLQDMGDVMEKRHWTSKIHNYTEPPSCQTMLNTCTTILECLSTLLDRDMVLQQMPSLTRMLGPVNIPYGNIDYMATFFEALPPAVTTQITVAIETSSTCNDEQCSLLFGKTDQVTAPFVVTQLPSQIGDVFLHLGQTSTECAECHCGPLKSVSIFNLPDFFIVINTSEHKTHLKQFFQATHFHKDKEYEVEGIWFQREGCDEVEMTQAPNAIFIGNVKVLAFVMAISE